MGNKESTENNNIEVLFSAFSCANDAVPEISINDYINRIIKYVKINKITFILAMCYIRKIIKKNSYLEITESNKHRLICSAILTAIIHFEDDIVCYKWYSQVCGISKDELERLVMSFVKLLDWELCCYDKTCTRIIKFKRS